jgi:hypothetical protein
LRLARVARVVSPDRFHEVEFKKAFVTFVIFVGRGSDLSHGAARFHGGA